jgi:hypothetical protein
MCLALRRVLRGDEHYARLLPRRSKRELRADRRMGTRREFVPTPSVIGTNLALSRGASKKRITARRRMIPRLSAHSSFRLPCRRSWARVPSAACAKPASRAGFSLSEGSSRASAETLFGASGRSLGRGRVPRCGAHARYRRYFSPGSTFIDRPVHANPGQLRRVNHLAVERTVSIIDELGPDGRIQAAVGAVRSGLS